MANRAKQWVLDIEQSINNIYSEISFSEGYSYEIVIKDYEILCKRIRQRNGYIFSTCGIEFIELWETFLYNTHAQLLSSIKNSSLFDLELIRKYREDIVAILGSEELANEYKIGIGDIFEVLDIMGCSQEIESSINAKWFRCQHNSFLVRKISSYNLDKFLIVQSTLELVDGIRETLDQEEFYLLKKSGYINILSEE